MRTMWNDRGFTLIEVLIALVILVLLSGALYGTYFSMMKGRDSATTGMQPLRDARATLDMLRRELASAYYSKNNERLHFIVEDRDIFGKPSSTLDFTTVTTPLRGSVSTSDLVEVRYQAEEKGEKLFLTRAEKDVFLSGESVPYTQIEELQGFLVECYNGSEWVKSWDMALNSTLPRAVRITLTITEGGTDRKFSAIAVPRVK